MEEFYKTATNKELSDMVVYIAGLYHLSGSLEDSRWDCLGSLINELSTNRTGDSGRNEAASTLEKAVKIYANKPERGIV